jgi:hypothetical protein
MRHHHFEPARRDLLEAVLPLASSRCHRVKLAARAYDHNGRMANCLLVSCLGAHREPVKIDAGHTDGHYELFEVDAPRRPTTPLHRTGWGKAYYVLNAPHDRPSGG